MTEPTLVALVGYLDVDRKTEGTTHIITMAGRKLSVPNASISSKHPIEPGQGGAIRFFLADDAIVSAEMHVKDLPEGRTDWSSDTAIRPRLGSRTSSAPFDGDTHWSHDTA
jgi:hypothetical protein